MGKFRNVAPGELPIEHGVALMKAGGEVFGDVDGRPAPVLGEHVRDPPPEGAGLFLAHGGKAGTGHVRNPHGHAVEKFGVIGRIHHVPHAPE